MEASEPKATPLIPPANDKRPKDLPKEKPSKEEKPKEGVRGTPSASRTSPGKFHKELAEFASLPALLFEFKGDAYPAYVWNTRITAHAYAWADLAERNPALKRKLQAMMEGGVYGAVIISGLAVLVPILAYYHLYPQGMLNPFALSPAEIADFEAIQNGQGRNGYVPHEYTFGTDSEGATPYPLDD